MLVPEAAFQRGREPGSNEHFRRKGQQDVPENAFNTSAVTGRTHGAAQNATAIAPIRDSQRRV